MTPSVIVMGQAYRTRMEQAACISMRYTACVLKRTYECQKPAIIAMPIRISDSNAPLAMVDHAPESCI
jgi:hypothetical protein